jgi:hypothetical protein
VHCTARRDWPLTFAPFCCAEDIAGSRFPQALVCDVDPADDVPSICLRPRIGAGFERECPQSWFRHTSEGIMRR